MVEQLTPERKRELIDAIAQRVVNYGLEVPAVLFLELHKPLAYLMGQGLLVIFPFLAPFFGTKAVYDASALLSNPDGLEALIRRIEELAAQNERSAVDGSQ